jgi:hypothetical protein
LIPDFRYYYTVLQWLRHVIWCSYMKFLDVCAAKMSVTSTFITTHLFRREWIKIASPHSVNEKCVIFWLKFPANQSYVSIIMM